jgi:hypothetical protein
VIRVFQIASDLHLLYLNPARDYHHTEPIYCVGEI